MIRIILISIVITSNIIISSVSIKINNDNKNQLGVLDEKNLIARNNVSLIEDIEILKNRFELFLNYSNAADHENSESIAALTKCIIISSLINSLLLVAFFFSCRIHKSPDALQKDLSPHQNRPSGPRLP